MQVIRTEAFAALGKRVNRPIVESDWGGNRRFRGAGSIERHTENRDFYQVMEAQNMPECVQRGSCLAFTGILERVSQDHNGG